MRKDLRDLAVEIDKYCCKCGLSSGPDKVGPKGQQRIVVDPDELRIVWVLIKRPGSQLSMPQSHYVTKLRQAKQIVDVVDSIDAFADLVGKRFGKRATMKGN